MLDQIAQKLFRWPDSNPTRRHTRRALGGAALAAGTIAVPLRASARNRKKKGKSCNAREEERCALDAKACRDVVFRSCVTPGGCAYALICCDQCSATGLLRCALGGS
jgi:hypothetical protein